MEQLLVFTEKLGGAGDGGPTPRSTLDHEAIAVLAKPYADDGRQGGLLKMYLQDRDPDRQIGERLSCCCMISKPFLSARVLRKVTT